MKMEIKKDRSEQAWDFVLMLDRQGEALQDLAHYVEESWKENEEYFKSDMDILREYNGEETK